jgi:microcystin-dependent protein
MEVFVGTILTFGFNFAPTQWALCNGQLIAISQNQALFALLGTVYGGNGVSTFQLPNLQSRTPVGFGQGLGLSPYVLGQAAGSENVSLTIANMPTHTHVATATGGGASYQVSTATTGGASAPSATNNILCGTSGQKVADIWTNTLTNPVALGGSSGGSAISVTNQVTGQSLPTPILNPYLAVNFSIALFGIFPTRN